MTRRLYGGAICGLLLAGILPCSFSIAQGQTNDAATAGARMDPALAREWMQRWKETILRESRTRWCDQVMGEAIADVVGGPFLSGFCQGYMATGDREWVDRFIDWTDSVVKRGVKEPDGYIGWPRDENGDVLEYLPDGMKERYTDTEVGDAWFFRPIVLMAGEILKSPALKKEYGAKAEEYIRLAERTFEKWESRGAWRETKDGGGVWVIPPFGIDRRTGQWTEGYEQRKTDGVSMPDNKENSITLWMIAMYDVTQKPIYRERVGEVDARAEVAHEAPRERQVFRLELLGPGRPVGLQAGWLAEALGGRAPERPLLPAGRGRDRGGVGAWPGLHEGRHRLASSPRTGISCGTSSSRTRNSSGLMAKSPPRACRRACSGPPWRLMTRRCGSFLKSKPPPIRPVGRAWASSPRLHGSPASGRSARPAGEPPHRISCSGSNAHKPTLRRPERSEGSHTTNRCPSRCV